MPTFNQLVRKGRETVEKKSKSPRLRREAVKLEERVGRLLDELEAAKEEKAGARIEALRRRLDQVTAVASTSMRADLILSYSFFMAASSVMLERSALSLSMVRPLDSLRIL